MQLISIVIGPVLVLWLVMSRVPRVRWTVAAVLAALIVGGGVLVTLMPRGVAEVVVVSVPAAAAAVVAGRRIERRAAGPGTALRVRAPTWLLGVWLVFLLCAIGVVLKPEPFHPNGDSLMPLPDGLTATVQGPGSAEACGTGMCTTHIVVTGRPGQPDPTLITELRRHLASRGWAEGCQPVGWLLVRGTACASVVTHDGRVTISLTGLRD